MGTISDKLMRIINTKEDIRQALISKGYDVPTSIPFKEYAKMISDLPCMVDSFPDIEGIVARYSALGLTNEQMAANPVWVDETGNGHDLQMKNFLWGGMSGVGGYVGDFSKWVNNRDTTEIGITKSNLKVIIDVKVSQGLGKNIVYINKSNLGISNNVTIKITSTYPEGVMKLANLNSFKYLNLPSNGIITLQYNSEYTGNQMYLYLGSADLGQITIEQLPLYPGFILGDGVDDFAVTEKELNFEDTYTVYTAFIPFQDDPTRNMMMAGKDIKDFYMNYSSLNTLSYYSGNKSVTINLSNGFNLLCCKRDADNMTIKNLITGDSVTATANEFINNPGLYYLWRVANGYSYARLAIAGQTICNGYFSTDEDDEKVLDWYKKQYPWLFPYQAWTVTGKTNEDEDRATIANIMGNGNDLVLSNFGFAEGGGYGLYAYNFNSFNLGDNVVKPTDVKKDSFRIIGTGDNSNVLVLSNTSNSADWKIRITGMKDGDHLLVGNANKSGDYVKITKDGVYTFQKQYAATSTNGIWYNSSQEVDVLVEQTLEYEGYLVTDGVDDKIVSAKSIAFTDTWTIITDAIFLGEKVVSAGILVKDIFGVSNLMEYGRVEVSVKGGVLLKVPTPSIKAICSDGRIYDADWNEYQAEPGTIKVSEGKLYIGMWYNGMQFCSIAFKNIATYNGYALSKDDCIKAYNYLQTIKAK